MKLTLQAAASAVFLSTVNADVGYNVVNDYTTTLLKNGEKGSSLYSMDIDEIGQGTAFLLDLHGDSHYDMGYDEGLLIGDKIYGSVHSLMDTLTGGIEVLNEIMEEILLWQWDIALSHQTPSEYLDELQGITDGSKVGFPDLDFDAGHYGAMGIVLSNLPGDGDDIVYVLLNELPFNKIHEYEIKIQKSNPLLFKDITLKSFLKNHINWLNPGCSNFGVWGSRTTSSELYTGRNLDWSTDTGVNNYKLVTIYHPSNGYSHATIGFAGIVGALTGISENGITVHEANLESDLDTFYGFPWTLRLRYVMETTKSIAEASALWSNTNNTCGFNHAVGSSSEADGSPKFMALETDAGHTATFFDMDDRELNAANGNPRPDALYRTNHGFDPQTVAHYQWNGTHADTDSNERYALFPAIFDNITLGEYNIDNAIYTVAVLGQKGDNYYQCGGLGTYSSAENVISAAYAPQVGGGALYAAWEVGTGDDWVPACCSSFVKVDLSQWW